ncbi:hypothetical protein F4604DRAFT_1683519 [Suillus subluteus]|nr:hypothetical protein F4604DRAFT_1683519 [Suillus subluteus]
MSYIFAPHTPPWRHHATHPPPLICKPYQPFLCDFPKGYTTCQLYALPGTQIIRLHFCKPPRYTNVKVLLSFISSNDNIHQLTDLDDGDSHRLTLYRLLTLGLPTSGPTIESAPLTCGRQSARIAHVPSQWAMYILRRGQLNSPHDRAPVHLLHGKSQPQSIPHPHLRNGLHTPELPRSSSDMTTEFTPISVANSAALTFSSWRARSVESKQPGEDTLTCGPHSGPGITGHRRHATYHPAAFNAHAPFRPQRYCTQHLTELPSHRFTIVEQPLQGNPRSAAARELTSPAPPLNPGCSLHPIHTPPRARPRRRSRRQDSGRSSENPVNTFAASITNLTTPACPRSTKSRTATPVLDFRKLLPIVFEPEHLANAGNKTARELSDSRKEKTIGTDAKSSQCPLSSRLERFLRSSSVNETLGDSSHLSVQRLCGRQPHHATEINPNVH